MIFCIWRSEISFKVRILVKNSFRTFNNAKNVHHICYRNFMHFIPLIVLKRWIRSIWFWATSSSLPWCKPLVLFQALICSPVELRLTLRWKKWLLEPGVSAEPQTYLNAQCFAVFYHFYLVCYSRIVFFPLHFSVLFSCTAELTFPWVFFYFNIQKCVVFLKLNVTMCLIIFF